MSVYVVMRLKITDRAAYDRYLAGFFDVFRNYNGPILAARRGANLDRRTLGR
ncbi:uncharacterized protein (DUF1330 family) [Bradyrhizobium sp. USDA 4369]